MCALTNIELDKLSVMYEGDKSRDAADKIRGFLFQDYVYDNKPIIFLSCKVFAGFWC